MAEEHKIQLSLKRGNDMLNVRANNADELSVTLASLFGIPNDQTQQAFLAPYAPQQAPAAVPVTPTPEAIAAQVPGTTVLPQQPVQPVPVQPVPVQPVAPAPVQTGAPCGICGQPKVQKYSQKNNRNFWSCNNWSDDQHKAAKAAGQKE